jgi:hypothetical protein
MIEPLVIVIAPKACTLAVFEMKQQRRAHHHRDAGRHPHRTPIPLNMKAGLARPRWLIRRPA